jgi:hypothetical protein
MAMGWPVATRQLAAGALNAGQRTAHCMPLAACHRLLGGEQGSFAPLLPLVALAA